MTIKEIQTTIAHKRGGDEVTERVYMVRDAYGAPESKVTIRNRLITVEAVGTCAFSMNPEAHIKMIEELLGDDEL